MKCSLHKVLIKVKSCFEGWLTFTFKDNRCQQLPKILISFSPKFLIFPFMRFNLSTFLVIDTFHVKRPNFARKLALVKIFRPLGKPNSFSITFIINLIKLMGKEQAIIITRYFLIFSLLQAVHISDISSHFGKKV